METTNDYRPPINFPLCRCSGCSTLIISPTHYIFPMITKEQQVICRLCNQIIYNYAHSLKFDGLISQFIKDKTESKPLSALVIEALQAGITHENQIVKIFGKQQNV